MSPCFILGMELHFQGEGIRVVFPSRPSKDRSLEVAMGVSLGTCVHVLIDVDWEKKQFFGRQAGF